MCLVFGQIESRLRENCAFTCDCFREMSRADILIGAKSTEKTSSLSFYSVVLCWVARALRRAPDVGHLGAE